MYESLYMLAGPMPKRLKISEARARLPELVHFLAEHPDEVVIVEHRDLAERVALITEGHLRTLEEAIKMLRQMSSPPFELAGSLASELDDAALESALTELRAAGRSRTERKLRQLTK